MDLAISEETQIWVNKSYRTHVPTVFTYVLSIILLVLWNEFSVPLQVVIVFNLLYRLCSIPYVYSTLKEYPSEKPLVCSQASEILFWILLIPVSLNKYNLIFAGIPLYLHNFLISFIDYKNSLGFNLFSHFICCMINWGKSLVIICISLKLNNNIQWDWIYLFWPFWITSGISLLISFTYLAYFILMGCKNLKQSFGQLWVMSSLIIYSISLILLIIGFSSLFYSGPSVFTECYIIAASCLLVHLSSTLILKKQIVAFIVNFFTQTHDKEPEHSIKKVFKTVKKTFQLFKINSTLYSFNKRDTKAEKALNDSVKECVICCENECDSVFMPCGHAGVCNACALKLLETTKLCHICRKPLEKVLKILKDEDKVIVITEMENE